MLFSKLMEETEIQAKHEATVHQNGAFSAMHLAAM